MKIKKLLKMVIPVLMISAVGTTFVEANQIGAFSNFVITTSYKRTGYLTKENEGAEYIMNLNPCRNLHPMTVKHRIVNSNGEARSGESLTTCGTRSTHGNWATVGYVMARQNWWDLSAAISGSWSPN
ncbi:Uncharacterised protein [Streptococcus pneumoniae]|uniref:hypothetical protein n=1 Tax=Streptococcus pneumoniae TaxID=1313 RepID=UPI0007653FF3|nr:hypothetical protein [Streptococcus pneumoniae]CVO34294.1 Uncharacterised protein [Streptococcus pneumoniae]CWK53916.1 Uncharacterised protein [Streptococcus pneumoniae]